MLTWSAVEARAAGFFLASVWDPWLWKPFLPALDRRRRCGHTGEAHRIVVGASPPPPPPLPQVPLAAAGGALSAGGAAAALRYTRPGFAPCGLNLRIQ